MFSNRKSVVIRSKVKHRDGTDTMETSSFPSYPCPINWFIYAPFDTRERPCRPRKCDFGCLLALPKKTLPGCGRAEREFSFIVARFQKYINMILIIFYFSLDASLCKECMNLDPNLISSLLLKLFLYNS